jgi:MFS family permease
MKSSEEEQYLKKNFSLVLTELGISALGSSVFTVAILWVTVSSTKSALITGIVSAFLVIPLLFNFLIGSFIDGTEKKNRYATLSFLLRGISSLILIPAELPHSSFLSVGLLIFSAIIYGFTMDFLVSVRAIWIQNFVKKTQYMKGNSIYNIVSGAAGLIGYFLSAVLMVISIEGAVVFMAIMFFASGIIVLFVDNPKLIVQKGKNFVERTKGGFTYVMKSDILKEVIIISMISALFAGMTDTASSVMINLVFHLTASYLSYAFVCITVGGLVSQFVTSKINTIKMVGSRLTLVYLFGGLTFSLISFFPNVYTLLTVYFVSGFLLGFASPIVSTVFFGNTERAQMGRAQGLMDTMGTSFESVSGIIAGALMTVIMPKYIFFIMASGLIALSILTSAFKRIRLENICAS